MIADCVLPQIDEVRSYCPCGGPIKKLRGGLWFAGRFYKTWGYQCHYCGRLFRESHGKLCYAGNTEKIAKKRAWRERHPLAHFSPIRYRRSWR